MRPWELRSMVWSAAWRDATDAYIMLVLAEHADEDGSCFPSQQTIATFARCSLGTVRRRLKSLEEAGAFRRERRSKPDGNRASDRYVIELDRLRSMERIGDGARPDAATDKRADCAVDKRAPGERLTSAHPGARAERPRSNIQKAETPPNPPSTLVAIAPTFEAFWDVYPRRAGKDAARVAWTKAGHRANPVDVLAGALRFASDPNLPRDEPQFIPHPATWLNQGRWADDPLPPRGGKQTNVERSMTAIDNVLGGANGRERGPVAPGRNGGDLARVAANGSAGGRLVLDP